MCLAQGHNTVRLEPAAPRSPVKHSTTELPMGHQKDLNYFMGENFHDFEAEFS